jgi:hypothetical protein
VAHTFDELVQKRRAADQAYSRVQELRGSYGPPTQQQWTARQSDTYETAVRAWRDLDRDWRTAMNDYIRAEGETAQVVEAQVRRALETS